MKYLAPLLVGTALILGAGCAAPAPSATGAPSESSASAAAQPPSPENATLPAYTLADVAAHASKEDCWMIIHDQVYNVTAFIPRHPGRDAIVEGCGKDATLLFETRPMGSGTPHSQRARDAMAPFLVGTLAQP